MSLLLVGCQSATEVGESSRASGKVKSTNPYLMSRNNVPDAASDAFEKALSSMNEGDIENAKEQFKSMTEMYPTLSGPYLNLALLYSNENNVDIAEEFFQKAIKENSNNVYALNQYGIFLREQGRFDESEARYLQALSVWPQFAEAKRNLAILYDLYLGELVLALQQYNEYQGIISEPDQEVMRWQRDITRTLESLESSQGEIVQ